MPLLPFRGRAAAVSPVCAGRRRVSIPLMRSAFLGFLCIVSDRIALVGLVFLAFYSWAQRPLCHSLSRQEELLACSNRIVSTVHVSITRYMI